MTYQTTVSSDSSASPTHGSHPKPHYELIALPARNDNYIWLIRNPTHAWVVDPSLAEPVRDYIAQHDLTLADLLITHHHYDHVEGIAELTPLVQGRIIGDSERIHGLTERVHAPTEFTLSFSDIRTQVLSTPGHTYDHVSYYCPHLLQTPVLFCGDALFSAGCGRIFDGTMAQAFETIEQFIQLPDETLIACAHEYTLSNLDFALRIQSAHEDTQAYLNQVKYARERGLASLPSSIGLEKRINPFCRAVRIGLSTEPLDTAWIEGLNHLAQSVQLPAVSLANVDTREPNARKALALALFTLCRELKNRI